MTIRHRLSAAAALLLGPLGAAVTLVAAIRGLPGLLIPLLLFASALYLGWKALVRRGVRRRVHAALAVLAFVASVVGVAIAGIELPLLALGIVLLVAAGLLAGSALVWIHKPSGRLVGPARHPVLIVNPRSGDGVAEETSLIAEARARGIRVVEFDPDDDLVEVARTAARLGADCLGMAGGDGSMACVAQEAMAAHIPFVCIPAGTRNHFALDLGLDRSDPIAALDAFGEAFQRRIDVGVVNGRVFVNNVSIGAYGEVVADEQYRERKLGTALDVIPDLVGPESEPLDLQFVDGEGEDHDSAVVIQVSNNSYELTPAPGFGSRASLNDGVLGVVAVTQSENGSGAVETTPKVRQWSAPSFRVASGAAVMAGVDGEAQELSAPVLFSIRRNVLRVRLPRDIAGISPAAKRAPLTLETGRRLLSVARGVPPLEH